MTNERGLRESWSVPVAVWDIPSISARTRWRQLADYATQPKWYCSKRKKKIWILQFHRYKTDFPNSPWKVYDNFYFKAHLTVLVYALQMYRIVQVMAHYLTGLCWTARKKNAKVALSRPYSQCIYCTVYICLSGIFYCLSLCTAVYRLPSLSYINICLSNLMYIWLSACSLVIISI